MASRPTTRFVSLQSTRARGAAWRQPAVAAAPLAGLLVAGILLGAAPMAGGGELALSSVAADAVWVAHVDFDALYESTVVGHLYDRVKDRTGVQARLGMLKQMLGFDLLKDLDGVTFYGKQIGKPSGVMIVQAKLDQKKLFSWAAKMPGHEQSKHGVHDLHLWIIKAPTDSKPGHAIAAASFDEDQFVVADSLDSLRAALDVLHGKQPSASERGPVGGHIPPGTIALIRATGVSGAEIPCKDPIAKQTESFRFVLGEHDGKSFYRSRSTMTSPEAAEQLAKIVEGARALGTLVAHDDPAAKKLLDALRIKPEAKTMTVLWSAPAEDVWSVLQAHEEDLKRLLAHHHRHDEAHAKRREPSQAPARPKPSPEEDF